MFKAVESMLDDESDLVKRAMLDFLTAYLPICASTEKVFLSHGNKIQLMQAVSLSDCS